MKKLLLIILIASFGNTYAQNTSIKNEAKNVEGIQITYKWKHSKCFNKKSPKQLNIQLKNTNDYSAKVGVILSYYMSGLLIEQSDTVYNCILPKKTAKGSKKKLNFSIGNFTNEDLNKPEFSYDIKILEVVRMRSCTKEQ